jgi:hypothetical protein
MLIGDADDEGLAAGDQPSGIEREERRSGTDIVDAHQRAEGRLFLRLRERHGPPVVDNMLAPHVANFARTLAAQQDHAQSKRVHAVDVVERVPKRCYFAVGKHTLAIASDIPCHGATRIDRQQILTHAPCKDRGNVADRLHGDARLLDRRHRGLDVGAGDRGRRHRGRAKRRTKASACFQLRLFFFACSSR